MLARNTAIIPIASAVDLSGQEGKFVTVAGALTGANAAAFGVVTEGYPVGMNSSVAVCAGAVVVKLKLGGNVTAGALVGSNASGLAVTGATTVCAQVLEAGSTDELVEAVLFRPGAP